MNKEIIRQLIAAKMYEIVHITPHGYFDEQDPPPLTIGRQKEKEIAPRVAVYSKKEASSWTDLGSASCSE